MKNTNINQDKTNRQRSGIGGPEIITNAGTLSILMPLFIIAFSLLSAFVSGLFNTSIVSASSLTVSIASSISLDLAPSGDSTFASSDTTSPTVSVTTDNYTGYTLSIAAKTNNSTALTYTNNGNVVDSIPSITSAVSASNYQDDSYAISNNLNNTWGFRPSKYNSNDNTDYLPIPSSTTATTLDATTTPNTTANTYNIAIGARVGMDKTPGDYNNTFVITVLANATPYSITYNANTTSSVSNMPSNTNSSSVATNIAISSTTPTRTGYNFTGWCMGTSNSSNITTTAGVDSCNSTTISAGNNITLDQTSSSNNFYLYAMWSIASYSVTVNFAGTGISSVAFTNSTYGNATTVSTSGGTTTLKYGVPYTITATISSGNKFVSWATASNGTLASTTTNPTTYTVTGASTLTATGKSIVYMQDFTKAMCQEQASSSNVTVYDRRDGSDYTVRYINGNCWMTQNLRFTGTSVPSATSNVTANKTLTYYSLNYSDAGNFGAYSGHCNSNDGFIYACIYDSGSTTTGVWYNYYAATAGTVSGSSTKTAASQDICPKNWHLPTGPNTTANTDFNKLVGNTTRSWQNRTTGLTAFSAVAGGYYENNGSLRSTGYGYWWSATAINTQSRYSLYYNSSNGQFFGDGSSLRHYGGFVRCVRSS